MSSGRLRGSIPNVGLGRVVTIGDREPTLAEVVGFADGRALMLPLGELRGLTPGAPIVAAESSDLLPEPSALLGRVVDALGRPIDGGPEVEAPRAWSVHRAPPAPMERAPIERAWVTGTRVVDGLFTLGVGQRVGVFSGPGVGKTTLLQTWATSARADVVVCGLIGERGREVGEFISGLSPEARARSLVVAATSDAAAPLRRRAAWTATAAAEWFRDQGREVLLIVDSLTRFGRACTDVALASGEAPGRQGVPASVATRLPELIERAGPGRRGAITALYTVLQTGSEDLLAEEVKSLLDGHLVLDPDLAASGHHPAIDVGASVSRCRSSVTTTEQRARADRVRSWCAARSRVLELLELGAYAPGAQPEADVAVAKWPRIEAFLRQSSDQSSTFEDTQAALHHLTEDA